LPSFGPIRNTEQGVNIPPLALILNGRPVMLNAEYIVKES
jgi:hypothetical protein